MVAVLVPRLEIRPMIEDDGARLVELLMDADFMAFSNGSLGALAANGYVDRSILDLSREIRFATKQLVIDRGDGRVLGYADVDRFVFEGRTTWSSGLG